MGLPYAEVIGDPVAQSKSPLIHHAWLDALGVAGDYRRTRVAADDLQHFLHGRRSDREWRGCNVTVPHKQSVIRHLDRLDAQAAAVGAVNCVVPSASGLTGSNTDVEGVAAALGHLPLAGTKVALIGAGGAARAAAAYLAGRGIAELSVLARSPEKAGSLRDLLPATALTAGAFDAAERLFAGAALIVNASPLGMAGCPAMPPPLLDAVASAREPALFDMVYQPLDTAFLKAGRGEKIDGLVMLVGQAARAFELFFGTAPPAADRVLFDRLAAA